MAQYSNSEQSRARALMFGAVLLIISIGMLYVSIKHHDRSTAISAIVLGSITLLGLYSAAH